MLRCKTLATIYNRNEAPIVLERMKNNEHVLYEKNPNIRITTSNVSNWGNIFLIFTII